MIFTMGRPKTTNVYVRPTPRMKLTLEDLVRDVTRSRTLATKRYKVNQERLVAASWLMLADMDPEEAARMLEPYLARVAAILDGIIDDEPGEGPADDGRRAIPGHDPEQGSTDRKGKRGSSPPKLRKQRGKEERLG